MGLPHTRVIDIYKIILILVLLSLTITLSMTLERYEIKNVELVRNNNFSDHLKYWKKSGSGVVSTNPDESEIVLTSKNNTMISSIFQEFNGLANLGQSVLLTAKIKTNDVDYGEKAWESARIIFVGINSDNKPMYYVPHSLAMLNGSTDWVKYSKVFSLFSEVDKYFLKIQLVNVKGAISIRNLSLRPVVEKTTYQIFWFTAILLWCLTFIYILKPYYREWVAQKNTSGVILFGLIILAGIIMPVNFKHILSETVFTYIPLFSRENELFGVGHFFLFFLISILILFKALKRNVIFEAFSLLILFALVTETLQLLVDGRNFSLVDLAIDSAGVFSALVVVKLWLVLSNLQKNNHQLK